MNVLNAALEESVKRVVVTSSDLTLYDYEAENRTYSESDWLPVEKARTAYQKSKILAERAAWDFYEEHKKKNKCFDMSVIIPAWVLGPPLSPVTCASVTRFAHVFDPSVEKVENLIMGVCDVRDVALAHVRAAQLDAAVGQRILIVSSMRFVSTIEWTEMLRDAGFKVARVEDKIDPSKYKNARFDNAKMIALLNIKPTNLKNTVVEMAQSLIEYGIIKV